MPPAKPTDLSPKKQLRAGAAQVDITPRVGIPLTGFIARQNPSTGIHDRLFARALALDDGEQQVLLITCDLVGLDGAFVAAARAAIQSAAAGALPASNIMIACTHTHSGPASIFIRDCGDVDREYLEQLRGWLVRAAREALAGLRTVQVGIGRGQVDQGGLNRRQPGTPIDAEVSVIGLRDEAGKHLAVVVNYACHPVCLDHTNTLLSADYPGVLARMVQERSEAVVLFGNGAAGDINPRRMGDYAYAEELGGVLAAEVLRVVEGLEYKACAELRIATELISLPLSRLPGQEELEEEVSERRRSLARSISADDPIRIKIEKAMLGWAEDGLSAVLRGNVPAQVSTEIQAIRLGDAVLVGIPGEIFNGLGKEIKRDMPGCQGAVLGYTNNDIGYIPTRAAYARGGYEIQEAYKYYGYPAALAPEAGELLRAASARLVRACMSGSD
jgi:hypothetical protein